MSYARASWSGLLDRLRDACGEAWAAFVDHRFVRGLAEGSLPELCYRHYLVQDYLFLGHFCRAYGLAAYKSETLTDIRRAAQGLSAMIGQEMPLHIETCRGWGLTEEALAQAEEAAATIAYTRFVLERGLAGDLLDLQVALAPCVVGYAEIGGRLAANSYARRKDNPYRAWIETYAADDYQVVARAHAAHMDDLFVRRGGEARMASLVGIFCQATRLEAAFWEMGMNPPEGL